MDGRARNNSIQFNSNRFKLSVTVETTVSQTRLRSVLIHFHSNSKVQTELN